MTKLQNYNPDVLTCLANLSNDEVFTPPQLANQMLDMLPQELFRNPDTKFLDPCSKSGVFLREIAKRLIEGLADCIPDLQKRIDHIMHHQLYGVAITQLTALMSRRSLYCSKAANGEYSISHFDNAAGNVMFENIRHTWKNGNCKYCGASQEVYDRADNLETYAYQFIHTDNPNELYNNMTFDVIIGNPPYQLTDGGNAASAIPLYHHFILQAKKLNPCYLSMIVPARWFSGGRGLDDFRNEMLHDAHISTIVDYPNAADCFPGVEIKGGVCYFLWERDSVSLCKVTTHIKDKVSTMERPLLEHRCDVFIRYNEAIPILRKVQKHTDSSIKFSSLVSSQKPFGLRTYVQGTDEYHEGFLKLYANKHVGYISPNSITDTNDLLGSHKIFISSAYNAGDTYPHQIINKPFYGEPNSCCTETYIVIGPFTTKTEAENAISYMKCRFFRFLVLLLKISQHAAQKVYSLVPMQDFSKPWTDEELYAKYELTADEIAFIESMIRPME